MNIERKDIGNNEFVLTINGRIDVGTSALLREGVAVLPDDTKCVTFDFRDVLYISSSGLRELLICRKKFTGDRMKIINVSDPVYDIFTTTGFDELLPIERASGDVATYVGLSFEAFLNKKVAKSGDKVVLKDSRRSYTFEDIEKGSQIISHDLSKLGVRKGTHVGLCGINSVEWVMTFFAIQNLEAMAMLINPSLGVHELINTAKIADIEVLCYGKTQAVPDEDTVTNADSPIRTCYSFAYDVYERFDEYEDIKGLYADELEADDPAVVIFTSGSTGRPKGVLLSSYNILNAAAGNGRDQTITESDSTCLILPLFHIFGLVAGLFASLMNNATLVIPDDIRTDTLLSVIEKEKCTFFHSVPTMLIALMNNKDFDPKRLASLRGTIISGAAATKAQIERFKQMLPNDNFFSSYGLSEMAPVSITPYGDTDDHVTGTVGKPVDNISIRIAGDDGQECPIGVRGEILVQGFNLMVGYYKVPIEDQSIDEEGWLHTGDLGFLDEDGYLHLAGRIKELIIRGGENIMPGEVEIALSALDGIRNVKVLGVPSEFFGEEVAACIMCDDGYSFDEEAVKRELSGTLAKFKIPSHYIIYDQFPTLSTGKIDLTNLKKDVLERLGISNAK